MLMKKAVPMPDTRKTASGGIKTAVITSTTVAKKPIAFGGSGKQKGTTKKIVVAAAAAVEGQQKARRRWSRRSGEGRERERETKVEGSEVFFF